MLNCLVDLFWSLLTIVVSLFLEEADAREVEADG